MKKGKMFKKSISCLLAALMIIASMPFSAISASAANGTLSANSYQIVRGGSNTRWENNQFNIVNDQEADNTSIGIIKYDISTLKGKVIDSASLNFTIDSHNDDSQGLVFYYSNRLTNVTLNNSSTQDTLSNYGAGNVANESAASRYGFSTDNVLAYGNVNTSVQTSDVKTQLQTIVDSGATSLYVFVMQKTAGGLKGDRLDGVTTSDGWTDTKIKPANVTINYETSEYQPTDLKPFVAMTANDYGSFSADNNYVTAADYATVYKNIVYAPKKMSSAAHTSEDRSYEQQNKMYGNMSFWYGNTVMLYDGETSPQFAVGFVNGGKSIPWNWNWGNNRSYYCKTLTDGFSLVNTKWHGADGSMNAQWLLVSSGREVNCYNDSNNSGYYTQGKQTGYYANIMQYSGGNFSENYISKNLTFEYKVGNDKGTGTYSDTVTEATIYVLNYKKIIENVNTARNFYNTIDKAHVNRDSLIAYATAVNNLQAFNPSDYDYSTNTAKAVASASDKMTSLINAVNQAKDNLKYDYTFIDINNNSTVVTAKNANEAYSKKPANTENKAVQISDTQHTKYTYTWPTNPSGYVFTEKKEEVTENHNFTTTATCTCGAKVDDASFEAAKKEAAGILTQSSLYENTSFTNFMNTVSTLGSKRSNGELLCQDDFDRVTCEILYAKTLLKKNQGTVTLTVYDQNNQVITDAGDSYTRDYGEEINIAPKTEQNVYKWVIEKDGTTSEIYGQPSISYVVTGDATVKAYCNKAQTADEKYTKVTFLVGGRISDIKYVKANETLDTSTANKLQFPFFTTGEWDKESVQGSADVSSVTVNAELKPVDSDKCGVHIPGKVDPYQMAYDTRVDVKEYGLDDNVDYALSKSPSTNDIIAYMHGTVFYVPARKDVYVLKVNKGESTKQPKVNTVGTFTSVDDKNKYVGFNCKFSLPADCTPVEWGITFIPMNADYRPVDANGNPTTSTVFRIKTHSKENEYAATLSLSKNSTKYSAIKAKAYLKYKDSDNNIQVIYGDEYVQAFGTTNKFGITQ
ncbi:hypothetical protein [uncultured Eubacterium sp.]|uniref:hypothetical protein n=1 Tax=uncultured Eubacterium sp. TaxID=165185 RepID=UPI0015A8EBF6|nr:hypothetical protein [uncultured Eubacterium sp.]